MGQITIEIPQSVNRNYRLVSEDSAKEFLLFLEDLVKEEDIIEVRKIPPLQTDREE